MKRHNKYHDIKQPAFYGRNIEEVEDRHKSHSDVIHGRDKIISLYHINNPETK